MSIININGVSGLVTSGSAGTSGTSGFNASSGLSGNSGLSSTSGTSSISQSSFTTTYLTPGTYTWTPNAGVHTIEVICIGGGGGGGSGRKGAIFTNRFGGGGGQGGGYSRMIFSTSLFSGSLTIIVGTGGSGGVAVTVDTTNGNDGLSGGETSFGDYLIATGGSPGSGGTGTTSSKGGYNNGLGSYENGSAGGSSSVVGVNQEEGNISTYAPTGGGAGGSINSSNVLVTNPGSNGGQCFLLNGHTLVFSGGSGAGESLVNSSYIGLGGGGGNSSSATNAGAGGAGGSHGGGGGGGGASVNGASKNSGAGGAGGPGAVIIFQYGVNIP